MLWGTGVIKVIKDIKLLIKQLDIDRKRLQDQLSEVRSNQTWKCLCGKYHKIRDTEVVITMGWSRGYGYEDGHEYEKAFFLVCPKTPDLHNRMLNPDKVQEQFQWKYKDLFKSCTKIEDDKFKGRWGNNEYINDNHKKFEIDIKGVK